MKNTPYPSSSHAHPLPHSHPLRVPSLGSLDPVTAAESSSSRHSSRSPYNSLNNGLASPAQKMHARSHVPRALVLGSHSSSPPQLANETWRGATATSSPYNPPIRSAPRVEDTMADSHYHAHHEDDHEYDDDHGHHSHNHIHHGHGYTPSTGERSKFTNFLLPYAASFPILHAILIEKDSRRILYFMMLNFSFMAIQAFYGYAANSLGLLSDSIHMFFDCVALAVGLAAAVVSKWRPSEGFPFGFAKVETLSGFANGVFLILISIEIMFEACERLMEGCRTERLMELFVVGTLGLLVNLVGMMAFGHHHHGHGHGGHDHGGHDKSKPHSSCHGHSHDNENMYGIYLHLLADTMGSVAVMCSTALTHFWGWAGWDPAASFLIAVLILLSAIPLVKSSARSLLLTVPDSLEYNLREALCGIPSLRGVVNYAKPKFWCHEGGDGEEEAQLVGAVHIVAAHGADLEDVRDRAYAYLRSQGIDATLQVERENDVNCWCRADGMPLSSGLRR